jgi:hypothetical protein
MLLTTFAYFFHSVYPSFMILLSFNKIKFDIFTKVGLKIRLPNVTGSPQVSHHYYLKEIKPDFHPMVVLNFVDFC